MGANVYDKAIYCLTGTATLAEINAGTTLKPAMTGRKYQIVDFRLYFNGTFTTATSIDILVGTTHVVDQAIAGCGDGVVAWHSHANATLGAAFMVATAGAIIIQKTGSTAAGGTDLIYVLNVLLADA